MSRKYTAQEMREAANAVDEVSINDSGEYFYEKDDKFNPFLVRAMLRQAADDLGRERRYEYAVKVTDILDKDICCIYKSADLQDALNLARRIVEFGAPLHYEDANEEYQAAPVRSEAWNSPLFRNYLHGKNIK